MSIVAGVDFGTLSVRISIFDKERGKLGMATAEYPLHRSATDPNLATQSHDDQMTALTLAMHEAVKVSGIEGNQIRSIALDTTGSSVIMVGEGLVPLGEYYLWADHRAAGEAAEITEAAHRTGFEGIEWCGGVYSSEWGWSKLLHWLRHNPTLRPKLVTALEHCDMVAATLCGITDPNKIPRSICAMGHKWMWNPRWGGLPPEEFLVGVDPLLAGVREKITGKFQTSEKLAGHLSAEWAEKLGLEAGIPIPTGAFDAHWDAVGANIRLGDVVNVIGTSTCIIGMSDKQTLVPGVCGVVPGSVYPNEVGIEAGMSAVGDIFAAIAKRAGKTVAELSAETAQYQAGQTGLLRLTWDNGDRTVLVNPELGGVTFGWNLYHTAADELFAAVEGTALHTRVIFERMEENGAPINRVINGGGIPKRNATLNQIYANALNKPVLVPDGDVTSLGSVIFAFLAAGDFDSIKTAQDALCPPFKIFEPQPEQVQRYNRLYPLFRSAYFALGSADAEAVPLGRILPELRAIRKECLES
ncbi:ribulokinase [Granulicella arctica]|uniref:L-ribulokinase n=1 Tax=Granulicella arctica TaxID=940613 RepID=A0A7Y9PI96_9BACT|nr:ribulokinase [Granulicella arctica]NYF80250.1 L-ribulokinase [Granulicella arctica]